MPECGCATRSHLYRASCERCQARMIARTPPALIPALRIKLMALWPADQAARMRTLIAEERAAEGKAE